MLLIINADDYGLTEGVSRGILAAHRKGIVTSTSVLATGPAAGRTAGWLKDEEIGVGVHLAVVGEDPPLLSAREIPSLVDRQGRFPLHWRRFLLRSPRVDPAELALELRAQLEAVRSWIGRPLTHLDSHQHLHLWGRMRAAVLDLARAEKVPSLGVPASGGRRATGLLLNLLARRTRGRAAGLALPEASEGFDDSGRMDESRLLAAIARLRLRAPQSALLGVHPGEAADPERGRYRWGFRWGEELSALTSPAVREAVRRAGFVLGRFDALTHPTAPSGRDPAQPPGGAAASAPPPTR